MWMARTLELEADIERLEAKRRPTIPDDIARGSGLSDSSIMTRMGPDRARLHPARGTKSQKPEAEQAGESLQCVIPKVRAAKCAG